MMLKKHNPNKRVEVKNLPARCLLIIWHKCQHITILMRKTYRFRMIGGALYCTPIRPENKQ